MSTTSPFKPVEFKGPPEEDADTTEQEPSQTSRSKQDKVLMLKQKHSGIVRQKEAEKNRDIRSTSNKKQSKFVLAQHGYVPGVDKGKDEGARRKFAGPHRIYTEMDDDRKVQQKGSDEIITATEEQQFEQGQFEEHQDQVEARYGQGQEIEISNSKSSRISGHLETIYSFKESEGGSGQIQGQSEIIESEKSDNLRSQALETIQSDRLQTPRQSKSSEHRKETARSEEVIEIGPQIQKRNSSGNDRFQLRDQQTSSSAVYESGEKNRYYRSMNGSIFPPSDIAVIHQQVTQPLAGRTTYSFRVAQRLPCLCGRRFRLIE
eukprot:TRINITY_DN7635_c0_g1_i3.p1 TRINITY_DN7635_c0_g1~~TRINITY_DN7635_c0_g1_i3.p1  ORF type:complete len:319 (-),score=34.26 TRINITY_DN7635_c0_g1_i3:428-1384(-)